MFRRSKTGSAITVMPVGTATRIEIAGDFDVRPHVAALLRGVGCQLSPVASIDDSAILLVWRGESWLTVSAPTPDQAFNALLAAAERCVGRPFGKLTPEERRQVVMFMRANGAFALRNAADRLSGALGISKGTVYKIIRSRQEHEDHREIDPSDADHALVSTMQAPR